MYHEQIKVLKFIHPELYRCLSKGRVCWWSSRLVLWCRRWNENRTDHSASAKGSWGHNMVKATRNTSVVAEFEIMYHEILSNINVHSILTYYHPMNHTYWYALNTIYRPTSNKNIAKLMNFVLERQNPYSVMVSVHVPLQKAGCSQRGSCVSARVRRRWCACIPLIQARGYHKRARK